MAMSAPYALQNATHNANLFRQATASTIPPNGGIVTPGDFNVTQTGTPSMAVVVGVGRIWIPGTELVNVTGGNFSTQSMYYAENDSADTRSVANSDPTNPRIDIVYTYVKDQAYSGTSNLADYAVAQGAATPGATYPANAPTLPNNAKAVAWINVRAGTSSILNSDITQLAVPYNWLHAEYTATASTTGGSTWGLSTLSNVGANSYNNTFSQASGSASKLTLIEPGIYSVHLKMTSAATPGSYFYGSIKNGANTFYYADNQRTSGFDAWGCTVSMPDLLIPAANTDILFGLQTANSVSVSANIYVDKKR